MILVDNKIYDWISSWLKWYASDYVQQQLTDTKALVIPLDLANIHAYDIYRMMENVYFDGLKDVNSSLIWLIMVWDIPFPVVNQDWYIFPTVYPYVDFEDQKYVWDDDSKYFVSNWNPGWQAEIWHWLINYWTDEQAYLDFFDKVKKYTENPDWFVWDSIWYDDFLAQKEWFLSENLPYYRNRIMFAEDLWYQRYSPLMQKMFRWEQADNAINIISDLENVTNLDFSWKDLLEEMNSQNSDNSHTTKMIQQEIQTSFSSDYSNLFSQVNSSIMRENIFAWWRWIKEYVDDNGEKKLIANSDTSMSKMQLKDEILLGNDNIVWLIENLNNLMEDMVDKKIEDENFSMDVVVPVSYKKVTWKRVWFKRYYFVDRYENYYFGNDARLIDDVDGLSIYRWTYRNLSNLSGVTYNSLSDGDNPVKSQYDGTDLRLKSIWWSYDIFSNQVEWNRGYTMMSVENDLDAYYENRTKKDSENSRSWFLGRVKKKVRSEICKDKDGDCELLYDFVKRWWWWASSINLNQNSVSKWRYELSGYLATDSWRPIFDMWWFQSLLEWDDEWMWGTWWINWLGTWPQWAANSFKAYIKYASPTQKETWEKHWWILPKYVYYENHTPDVHGKSFSDMDYFGLNQSIIVWSNRWNMSIDPLSDRIFNISRPKSWRTMEQYSFKVISSVAKHKSTTDAQINWVDRNRYGEEWILSIYYNDVKSAYDDLYVSMSGVLWTISDLMHDINSGNVYISSRFVDLWEWVNRLSSSINDNDGVTGTIDDALDDVSELLDEEHSNLSGFYYQLQWLYVENIISTMDSIIYMEWWNVDDYYQTWNTENLLKVWFLPNWLSNIKDIRWEIVWNLSWILQYYDDVWLWINNQKSSWDELYAKLRANPELNQGKIDEISKKFEDMFWIERMDDEINEDDGEHEVADEDWNNWDGADSSMISWFMLTWWTVRVLLDSFEKDLQNVDVVFSNLFVEDKVWSKIESEAKIDKDFRVWLIKNSIDYGKFDQSDWINYYAEWTKGPWYDSDGAKKNHDLLQWIIEHISWMNLLTPDRPIDSPRYVSMQSIAWNEIKFIYPDLFKVEVYISKWKNKDWYDIHELLTWWQIRNNLEKYLRWKMEEYNKILENECNNALNMNLYFYGLKDLGYWLATPEKWKHWCDDEAKFTYEEFVEALWWEKMLDIISEVLYYQNLTNKKKLSAENIEEDIELIKKSFNVNDKRNQLLKDYLVQWNEKTKNSLFEIPMYEALWYEVWFINSDGKDSILINGDNPEDYSYVAENTSSSLFTNTTNRQTQAVKQENDLSDKCNIPANGRLPLFKMNWTSPWLEWFKCWWKQTLESPAKLKLSFNNSLWDILSPDYSLKDYIKDSDLSQNLVDWWDSMSKFVDDWDSLLNPWTWYDSDKKITQMQVDAEKHNQNVVWWKDWLANALSNVYKNVRISNSNTLLSESIPGSEIKIESLSDVWNITVEFMWTGDWCIKLDSDALCDGNTIKKTFNPKTNPFKWTVMSSNHIAWKVALVMKINIWWWYLEKIIKYTISPSNLDHVDINLWDKKTIAWMITPVEVIWYDRYDNKIDWWLEKCDFTVSQWRFLKDWSYQSGFSTNDFRDLKFYYQAPSDVSEWSVATIQIKSSKNWEVLKTYNQSIVYADPVIKLNWKVIIQWRDNLEANEVYNLNENENIYVWWKLDFSKLQQIEINILDKNWKILDVDSQILISSQNGLVVVWQVVRQDSWDYVFSQTSKGYIKWGQAIMYYYPTTKAGNDIIDIDIPWLDKRSINLSIKPSSSSNVQFNIGNGYVKLDKMTNIELFVSDVWWNATNMTLYVKTDPKYVKLNWLTEVYHDDNEVISSITIKDWYAKIPIYWVWAWLTTIEAWLYSNDGFKVISDVDFRVDDDLLPESWLNIMYLNYFWNDRWNQWWYLSENDKYVESLMKNSNKTIATTTLLMSEDKIKKALWKIDSWFIITDFDNLGTTLSIREWKISVFVWWLSEMQISAPSFEWVTATLASINTLLNNKTTSKKNYIFFIPEDSKYSIKNWILYDSNNSVVNLENWEMLLKLSSQVMSNWDNVWSVVYKGVDYGKIITHFPEVVPSVQNFKDSWNRYLVDYLFTQWSTDFISSVWIFDWFSDFQLNSTYKSIQNSDEVDERVGFLWDFKNITLFAEWEIVWEATRKYWSELLINFWDPILSRKDVNKKVYGTNYDGWIWEEVYNDPEKNIFWVYQIDFNNDWLNDWLVAYQDGSLKLAKSYGWNPDFRNMQELIRVAVRIKNVFVGDADGNGYQDIFVLTNNNQIRVYLNNWWIFDVDWSVACLNQNVFEWEKSTTPSDLEWLNQFFVEDMDQDWVVDIVTYDEKWYIKVFYWWTTNKWPNYLSTEKYACDTWWYSRESVNTTVVTALWIQISNDDIFDNSMIHWVGMSKPEIEITENDMSKYWVNIDTNTLTDFIQPKKIDSEWSIEKAVNEFMSSDNFDIGVASSQFIQDEAKFVDVTLYENKLVDGGDSNNYVFAPSSFLDPKNPADNCSVWKNYYVKNWWKILMNKDIVTVRVTVKASDRGSCIWAYWDIIQWPWNVYYDESGKIKWIKFLQNKKNAEVKGKDWNFSYLIDNITLFSWERMVFEYDLEYKQLPLKKMSITYNTFWSNDKLPDIKLQSVDWCDKNFDWFVNLWKRSFKDTVVDLQKLIDKEYENEDKMTVDYGTDVGNWNWDISNLPWIVGNHINRSSLLRNGNLQVTNDEDGRNILKDAIHEAWINLDLDLNIFKKQTEAIENAVDDITKWMCNWFSFWWSNNCKWLPVPFNQAFLAPGKYHLFGCWELPMGALEWWLPSFFFPWTLHTPVWDIPIPWWLKSPTDWFLWPWWWTYPSAIRIYAAPTSTAQLWIAVCVSPDAIWRKIPSPISDIAGNCTVFAVKPQCKGWSDNTVKKKDKENPNEIYEAFVNDVKDSWVCLQSQKWSQVTQKWYRSSPFNLYSYSSKISSSNSNNWKNFNWWDTIDTIKWKNVDLNWWLNNQIEFETSFLWIINLETAAHIWIDGRDSNDNNSFFIGDVDILWWDFTVNKIRWWIQQWVRKMLIDKWLDPQIRYIANQLTKMHVNIKLPNIVNLIENEVWTIQNVSEDIDDWWFVKMDTWWSSSLWAWAYINHDNLNQLNNSISNPFERLAGLMNESNIINISTETLNVKVPMIFAEDINGYELYLNQWLDINWKKVDEWKTALTAWLEACSRETDSERKAICKARAEENLRAFVEFEKWDWQKMTDQIYANLTILQEYRNFPFEMYEWIHAIDRYMAEIASLINNVIWYLSYWTSTNAQRFVWYVDAIVLMLNIIKTYQLLIDFSSERWKSCWNCSKDTYDQYSCKLSILCDMIQLPIIQIPNFKLPNITIDLSNIDISLDIVLPKFKFQPINIQLPELPNLPEPPTVWVNIKLLDLPDIPLLPEPPELPELPSFIPEIELELPILPPAPELPRLPNEIESTIKIAKLIWKIYCIVKWKFGLVWESSVKAKIEQLTQRTYEVKWIDTIMDFTNRSAVPVRNYWMDYEIDSYVDLQFNFTEFYTYLDTLTKSINNLSNNLTTSAAGWVNNKTDYINNNPLTDFRDSIDGASVDVNMKVFGDEWLISKTDFTIDWMESDDIEYVDYHDAEARVEEVLTYFEQETADTAMWDMIKNHTNNIKNQINMKNTINPNIDGIENLKNDVMNYLDAEKSDYADLAKLINEDYDWFLAMVNSEKNKTSLETWQLLTFNVQLFNMDSSTKDTINTIAKSNPYEPILNNKKTIVDGYWNAINSNTANDLWLSQSQYLALRNYIWSMRNQVTTLYSVTKPTSLTNLIAKNSVTSTDKTLLSSTAWGGRLWSNLESASVVDPSVLSEWIYDRIVSWLDVWKLAKIVYSDYFSSVIWDHYYHTNHTEGDNIVLWDEGSIYLKCIWWKCSNWVWWYRWYYVSRALVQIPYEETWITFDRETKLKISDSRLEVKNRKVTWQTYDTLSLSRNAEDVDAYLIKLVERVDNSYEKLDYSSVSPVHYVLALPKWINLDSLKSENIKLELLKKTDKIEKLYWKDLVEVVNYDNNKNSVWVTISDVDRKWYYVRIATLNFDENVYKINSPWSNQIVFWKQIVWDDQAPDWEAVLYRPSIGQVVSQWDNLEWYVWTKYKLIVNWNDNAALYYINLSRNGKILDEKYTSNAEDNVSVDIDIHTKAESEKYKAIWVDQFGNRTEKIITVDYSVPEIQITNISKNSDGKTISVVAELSQDIDQWNVYFQKKRWLSWKRLKTKDLESIDFSVWPKQSLIVWWPYTVGNEIAMYDKNWEVMALMNPDTAEINLQPNYKNDYEVVAEINDGVILRIYNKNTESSVFSISIPTEKCLKIEADTFNIMNLPLEWKMGVFNWWKSVYKDWTNMLFVSSSCYLYSELWLKWTYDYDRELDAVMLTLYQLSDLSKSSPIKLWFKVKPFVEK